jgi:secondary thiamine-phosphate synthase enzyme
MKIFQDTFQIMTKQRLEFRDITKLVKDVLKRHDIQDGQVLLRSLHTTVALFINEFQDALIEDMRAFVSRLVPERGGYRHDDPRYSDCERGNADSHLRSAFLSQTVALPVAGGEMLLGRWQSIIMAELDGPRERTLQVHFMGE